MTKILFEIFVSMYIGSIGPDYITAIDDYQLYICPVPDHCAEEDECIDSYQMIEIDQCYNCSTENGAGKDFCEDKVPFEWKRFQNNTFGWGDENITVNVMQIVHSGQFSRSEYDELTRTFAADCLEDNHPSVCYDALFLAANFDSATFRRDN